MTPRVALLLLGAAAVAAAAASGAAPAAPDAASPSPLAPVIFEPTDEWQEVQSHQQIPGVRGPPRSVVGPHAQTPCTRPRRLATALTPLAPPALPTRPQGLDVRMDLSAGKKWARNLQQPSKAPPGAWAGRGTPCQRGTLLAECSARLRAGAQAGAHLQPHPAPLLPPPPPPPTFPLQRPPRRAAWWLCPT